MQLIYTLWQFWYLTTVRTQFQHQILICDTFVGMWLRWEVWPRWESRGEKTSIVVAEGPSVGLLPLSMLFVSDVERGKNSNCDEFCFRDIGVLTVWSVVLCFLLTLFATESPLLCRKELSDTLDSIWNCPTHLTRFGTVRHTWTRFGTCSLSPLPTPFACAGGQ